MTGGPIPTRKTREKFSSSTWFEVSGRNCNTSFSEEIHSSIWQIKLRIVFAWSAVNQRQLRRPL